MDKNVYFVDIEYEDAKVSFFDFKESEKESGRHWHKHIFYELHFSFEETLTYKFTDFTLTLNPGELLIIPPSVMHESVIYEMNSSKFKVLSVEIERTGSGKVFYDALTNGLGILALKPVKLSGISPESVLSFGKKELYESVLGICELKMYATRIVYALLKKTSRDKAVKSNRDTAGILIDNMIFSPEYSLDEIAEITNYSKRHVSRLIKEQYGATFSQIRKGMKDDE